MADGRPVGDGGGLDEFGVGGEPKDLNVSGTGKPSDVEALNRAVRCVNGYDASQDPDQALAEIGAQIASAKASYSTTAKGPTDADIPKEGGENPVNMLHQYD